MSVIVPVLLAATVINGSVCKAGTTNTTFPWKIVLALIVNVPEPSYTPLASVPTVSV